MEHDLGRTFHFHVSIVFDWKMMAMIVSAYLYPTTDEVAGGSAASPAGPYS